MLGARSIPARHGGLEVAVESLAVELAARGHAVRALVDGRSSDGMHAGVEVRGVGSVRTKHLHALTQAVASLPPTWHRRPDVAHVHGVGPGVVSRLVRLGGVRTVVTVHGLDWERDKWSPAARGMFRRGVALTLGSADAVIAVSRSVQGAVERSLGIHAHYVPNGVHLPGPVATRFVQDELGVEPGEYVLFAARLVPEKGLHFLLSAYRSMPDAPTLVVAGSGAGSYTTGYEQRLRAGAPGNVVFAGFRQGRDLQELFAHARVYVLPSVLEGLPLSLLEAMSHARPVLHSDIAECTEVTRGDAGRSFAAGDPADLARALTELLADDAEAAELGAAGRRRVEQDYDWPSVTSRTEEVYRSVLARPGS